MKLPPMVHSPSMQKTLGLNDANGLLQLTLDEERMADQGLTLIAQNKINWEAELEDVNEESGNLG